MSRPQTLSCSWHTVWTRIASYAGIFGKMLLHSMCATCKSAEAGLPAAIEYLLNSKRVQNRLSGNWEKLLEVKVPPLPLGL